MIYRKHLNFTLMLFWLLSSIACKKQSHTEACNQSPATDHSVDSLAQQFALLVSSVPNAAGYSYQTKDDLGHSMDCVKIIAYQNDTLLAVYHTYSGTVPSVNVAVSTDILHWHYCTTLGTYASQPAIYFTANKKFIVAYEQEPNNHIQLTQFNSFDSLMQNLPAKTKAIDHTFSDCAEGTPSIYYADDNTLNLGFHYWSKCDVDREASGTLAGFANWTAQKEPCIDNALLNFGLKGNIGDRDAFTFGGKNFLITEGQSVKNDFGSWSLFLYQAETQHTIPITIRTHHNSGSYSNATVSIVDFQNRKAAIVTTFIHSPNSGADEKGCLIYYQFL